VGWLDASNLVSDFALERNCAVSQIDLEESTSLISG
jgi:hypothetical protein